MSKTFLNFYKIPFQFNIIIGYHKNDILYKISSNYILYQWVENACDDFIIFFGQNQRYFWKRNIFNRTDQSDNTSTKWILVKNL